MIVTRFDRYLLLAAIVLAATPVTAYEAISARSYYMEEATGALLLYDLPEDLDDVDLRADLTTGDKSIAQDVPVTHGRLPWIRLPMSGLSLGATEIAVQLHGADHDLGRTLATVRRLAAKTNAVQIDRLGGGLIVDGLPFFPFGFYCYSPVQPTLAEEEVVRGFNLMSPYQSNDPATADQRHAYMDRAAELGMKVHFQLLRVAGGGGVMGSGPDTSATRRRSWMRTEIETFKDHPALLAWYISDEPTGHGATPEELQAVADIVRELDPYHPVTIVFVNPTAAARFAGAMDLAMTDPYPIPNGAPGSVASAVRTVRDAVAPAIPLWLVPQAFGGNEWWSREPTATELRLMTWLGIVEGATGIQYFIRHGLSGFPKSPDTWSAATRAALEVAALTPFLLSTQARPVVDTGDPLLLAAAWRHGEDVVVAVVNTQNHPTEIDIALPGFSWDSDVVEVLYEDRVVAAERISRAGRLGRLLKPVGLVTDLLRSSDDNALGVRFEDVIDAYGVRLYRFANPEVPPGNGLSVLIDGSFEWEAAPSIPTAVYADVGQGRGATYFVDSRVSAHGRRSLRLHAPSDTEGVQIRPYAPAFVPERTYRFSLRARARTAGVVLRLHNAAANDSVDVELTTDWRQYALDSVLQDVATRAWLSFGLRSAGTAWIDDMELFDISPRISTTPQPAGHVLTLTSVIDDADLRWRVDGGEVTAEDSLYRAPVSIAGAAQVRVGLFREDRRLSGATLDLYHHIALGRFTDLEHPYSPRYTGGGPGALTDGILGTDQFNDGRWQGFEGEDLVAVVDLGRPVHVSTVHLRFLQSTSSWIWLPRVMEVNLSDDGRHFRPFATADHDVDERDGNLLIEEMMVRAPTDLARYVRLRARSMGICPEWHPGAGEPAWVFADEIRINEE